MNYLNFKRQHELLFHNEGDIKHPKSNRLFHYAQLAFDLIFGEIKRFDFNEMPVWLFQLYNEFVRIVEQYKRGASHLRKLVRDLLLEMRSKVELIWGKQFALQLENKLRTK